VGKKEKSQSFKNHKIYGITDKILTKWKFIKSLYKEFQLRDVKKLALDWDGV